MNAMLTELGHHVDFAATGESAVSAMQRGGYDLVLMDIALPIVDGIEATRRIRALPGVTGRVPIIGISGSWSEGDVQRARDAGMTDYLTKPVAPAVLAAALRRRSARQSSPSL